MVEIENVIIKEKRFNKLLLRFLSSLFLLGCFFYFSFLGNFTYFIFVSILVYIAALEWSYMAGRWSFGIDVMTMITSLMLSITCIFMKSYWLTFTFFSIGIYLTYLMTKLRQKYEEKQIVPEHINRTVMMLLGMLYLGISFISFSYLIVLDYRYLTIYWMVLTVAAGDTGAYFIGSIIKGKKLMPKISPNKTWSGFIAGIISSALVSYLFADFINLKNASWFPLIGAMIAIFATMGDLLESYIKRYAQVKDSGKIIPGHGGVLDRIDSILMVSIIIAILSIILGDSILYVK